MSNRAVIQHRIDAQHFQNEEQPAAYHGHFPEDKGGHGNRTLANGVHNVLRITTSHFNSSRIAPNVSPHHAAPHSTLFMIESDVERVQPNPWLLS
jgi:hypothetical protein